MTGVWGAAGWLDKRFDSLGVKTGGDFLEQHFVFLTLSCVLTVIV